MYVPPGPPPPKRVVPRGVRTTGIVMGVLVGADVVLGVAALLAVPFHRRAALVPAHGRSVYVAHALLGALLGLAALGLLPRARQLTRPIWLGAVSGVVGVGVAAVGGALATFQSGRLPGMALMLVGAVAAESGYLMPLVDSVAPGDPAASPEPPAG